ncbi:DNA-binding protein [Dysgonomonas sp. 521]|uniref:helix-turn-helix domain-containing protein n=1 Tax=Dysgonomonas sp. 521 TaxID=2302932 RepID=UPI0013D55218|nr:helix-turn-helix domain-containing protein [Dysgonomonas sp. 521]NDV93414.1 DNA-binding protein [Dysgonomonas sp. 521]
MEIIAIEKRSFEQMKLQFEAFTRQVKELCKDNETDEKWLGNEEVCRLLQISKRTLQYYRDTGKLPFSQINYKCYYKVPDVEKLINESTIKNG